MCAQFSRFFGGPVGDVPEYTQPQFAEVLEKIFSNGVFPDVDDELAVSENDPVSLSVVVATGEGWINGFWYQNTAALTKSLGAADPTNPRIDRIVLRLDTVTNFKISIEVLAGTPGAVPVAPTLTQDASTWETSLAQVLVGTGVTSIADAVITDEREFVVVHGLGEQSTIITTIASSATPTPVRASIKTLLEITALAAAAEFAAPTGTPINGDQLFISATDDGTARALTYNAIYNDPYSATLYATTTIGKTLLMHFMYSSARSKWELLSADEEA